MSVSGKFSEGRVGDLCPRRVETAYLRGQLRLPLSKSMVHRQLFALFLTQIERAEGGQLRLCDGADLAFEWLLREYMKAVHQDVPSDDIQATLGVLRALSKSKTRLDCAESGSTLRFLLPLAAALARPLTLSGRGLLPQRPLRDFAHVLAEHGAKLDFPALTQGCFLPLHIDGQLRGGDYELPGHISSQYVSGLMFVLPLLKEDSRILLSSPLESRSYVDLTLDCLRAFSIQVEAAPQEGRYGAYLIQGGQRYRLPTVLPQAEADESQAAFFLLANYMGQDITLCGRNPQTRQGDAVFATFLKQLREGQRSFDISQYPDIAPALALACAVSAGESELVNAARLRMKESDRLHATAEMLRDLAVHTVEGDDSLRIYGLEAPLFGYRNVQGKVLPIWFKGGRGRSFHDHRIMMCLAIAALQSDTGIWLDDSICVNKSYPHFWADLARLAEPKE